LWFEAVFFPDVREKSALLIDSWTTNNDKEMTNSITPSNKELEIQKIPPKTTSMAQPLDKYGFRLWKNFISIKIQNCLYDFTARKLEFIVWSV
jgi:hypothetical protein